MEQTFTARPVAKGPNGAWTHLVVPFDVEKVFGSKSQVKVRGTINGVSFRNSLMPIGDGTHYMNIRKELKAAANLQVGTPAEVTMAVDLEERVAEVPEDLQTALDGDPRAGEFFAQLAFSHKKAYSDWIQSAKRPETRANRIAKAVEMLKEGKRIQ